MKKRYGLLYIVLLLQFCYSMMQTGCANIIAPTGGVRDTIAPKLLAVNPKDSSLHFNGNKITFYFDEYVQVENIQENLIVSPLPKINPLVDFKLRTVTVKLKDTLEENTTYALDFGNAIKDINEGNIVKHFAYHFSTGNSMDTHTFSGNVVLAETGKPDSTLIVLLHKNLDDSAVVNERPRFIARLDSAGNFRFNYLPEGTFALYALKDEGGTRRYLSNKQLFAFADSAVVISSNTPPVTLYAFLEKEEEKKEEKKPKPANVNIPGARKDKAEQEKDKRIRFSNNLENGTQDLLKDLVFDFITPLKEIDTSFFAMYTDKYIPVKKYTIDKDSNNKKLTIYTSWLPNTNYHIIIQPGFAEDTLGRTIAKADTLNFATLKEADYGSLMIRFANLDLTKKPVLQFFQNDQLKLSAVLTGKDFFKKLFKPGEYQMRILFDANSNGIWDAGKFFKQHLQPEKVEAVKKRLVIKANWDNEINISL